MTGVMVVTGGSRGIGAACARLAGQHGYKVCVNYNASPDRADEVVREIVAGGGEAIAVQADVAREAEVQHLFAETDRRLGPVTVLINNAGITGPVSRVDAIAADDVARVMQLNLVSAFVCAGEAVRRMSTAAGGSGGVIINMTSAAAKLGGANQYVHYAASKAGLEAFTIGLGVEVAREGIRVVGIRPGVIDTEIHAAMGMPDRVQELAPTVPMGRAGSAEEIARAALWLAGDDAGYITATTIAVSGGR